MITADEVSVLIQEPVRMMPARPTRAEKLAEAKRWLEERARRHPEWAVRRLAR